MTGAIFSVTVPAMIIRSACLGDGRMTSAPNRARSKRAVIEVANSTKQHAVPNVIGQMADLRAQLKTRSTVVIRKFCSNLFSSQAISPHSEECRIFSRQLLQPGCDAGHGPAYGGNRMLEFGQS